MLMFLHNDKYVPRISDDTINVSPDEYRDLQDIFASADIMTSSHEEDLRQCLEACQILGLEIELMRGKPWKVVVVETPESLSAAS